MKGSLRRITVEGLNLERFLRLAGDKHVHFLTLQRGGRSLNAWVNEKELSLLIDIAEQGGWQLNSGQKKGMGHVFDILKRKLPLICAACICALLLLAALQMAWSFQIVDAGIYREDVLHFLSEQSIHLPCPKKRISLSELRDQLEWRYPDVAWIDCAWRGTVLQISFVQGTPQGKTTTIQGSGDIIASRSGIIAEVITTSGTPKVTPGDLVRAGDVLILGREIGSEGSEQPVRAGGIVMARVWDSASARAPLTETTTAYTGRQHKQWSVTGPWFTFWQKSEKHYEQQDLSYISMPLGGLFLPFQVIMETHLEADIRSEPRNLEDVKTEAGEAAMVNLRKKIGFHDDFVDKWVDYCMIEDEVIEAVAYAERVINIGVPADTTD